MALEAAELRELPTCLPVLSLRKLKCSSIGPVCCGCTRLSSIPAEKSTLFSGVACLTRVLEIGAGAGAAHAGFGGAVRTTVDAFVSINVFPRCFLSFIVALADTESLCLEVPSHEEVEEVSSVPVSILFWLVAVSDPVCGVYCLALSRRSERDVHSRPDLQIIWDVSVFELNCHVRFEMLRDLWCRPHIFLSDTRGTEVATVGGAGLTSAFVTL